MSISTAPKGSAMTSRAEGGARPRALVVGTGLIGGSIALSLRRRGWHVAGLDADDERLAEALAHRRHRRGRRRPRRRDRLRRHAGHRGGRGGGPDPGHARAPRRRGGDRRERGEERHRGGGRSPPVHRWSPDGRFRAGGAAGRRPRPVRGSGLGAHAHQRHRPRRLHPPAGCGDRARCRRAGPHRRGPRPPGGRGLPRAPPGGGHADERRHGGGRAGPRPAAPGRRRVPGHDPGGGRAIRGSGPTSARRTPARSWRRSRRWCTS